MIREIVKMVFSSVAFLSVFLPLTLGLCALLRRRIQAQNLALLGLSLVFYAWGEIRYVPLLALSALGNGMLGRAAHSHPRSRWPLMLAAVLNVGLLAYYKYMGFFAQSLLGLSWQGPALPLGISFFTFQGLAYVADARRPDHQPGTLLEACLYICLFPQLVAGPILRWEQVRPALRERHISFSGIGEGFRRFIPGLAKKVLLADTLGKLADAAFACPDGQRWAPFAVLGGMGFCLQLYLDFSGYSDMALGLGKMLGFDFPENFDHPFVSRSMGVFWRRWHISLSRWFRDMVYIPLGGSRGTKVRTAVNLLITFALTGIWHGAGWNFLLWGLWNGLWVALEHGDRLRPHRWPRWLGHGYTLLIVGLGFILFRAEGIRAAAGYWSSLGHWAVTGQRLHTALLALSPDVLLALAVSLPVSAGLRLRLPAGLRDGLLVLLLVLCFVSIVAAGYHPFLYFRF